MSYYADLIRLEEFPFAARMAAVTARDVERVLAAPDVDRDGFLTLLSPSAGDFLEPMAKRAQALTIQHFGRVILLYTPLYLANYCSNFCLYCAFAAPNSIKRDRLSPSEVTDEARVIAATGLRHILLLTGESRKMSSVAYIQDCVALLRHYFTSIAVEVYPLETPEYAALIAAGVDGLTLYQETYDRPVYATLHPRGPKRDFRYRLEAPERACDAGMRSVNVGALLGLADWRRDIFLAGLHADYLQRRYLDVEVSISAPRFQPFARSIAPARQPDAPAFQPAQEVSDHHFVQLILAIRLFLPRAGITISTRERAEFRDRLIGLGVTRMSAGSRTAVGGRAHLDANTGQFEIADHRDVSEVQRAVAARGYKAIFKDWHSLADPAAMTASAPAGQAGGTS